VKPFEYATPKSYQQAVALLSSQWGQTEILAGGTDLLALMKDDVVSPKRLVNIKGITGIDGITFDASNGLRIGALARLQDIADHAEVRRRYPVLATALDDAASPQIRNMATIGGNLCQRPRCWYFRNGFGLLPTDPKSKKSMVLEGDNRYHAILGNEGPAYFVSPSSIAPVLIAMQAFVRLLGPKTLRELPLGKFFITPEEDEREHHLLPNEIVLEVVVPPTPSDGRFGNYEVRQKAQFDWPLATAAVALQMSGKTVRAARIVLGHVAPVPWLSLDAAQVLVGKEVNEQTADAAGQAAVSKAKSLGRNGYKIQLARVAVKRAILAAAKGGAA
jgi:xanthine dehydrogenase YagS FAD-binding subunit